VKGLSKDQTNQDKPHLLKKKNLEDQRLQEDLERMKTLQTLDSLEAALRELKPLLKKKASQALQSSLDQRNQRSLLLVDLVSEDLETTLKPPRNDNY